MIKLGTKNDDETTFSRKRPLLEPHIDAGMTLTERVRARAKYSKNRIQNNAGISKTSNILDKSYNHKKGAVKSNSSVDLSRNQGTKIQISSFTDNVTLLRLADALRSHIHRKQSRSIALKQSLCFDKVKSFAYASLKELSIFLSGSIYQGSSSTTSSLTPRKIASRKETTKFLKALAQSVPRWLTVITKKNNETKAKSKSNNLVMKIRRNVDYHACVTMVLGGRVCDRNSIGSLQSFKRNMNGNNIEDTFTDRSKRTTLSKKNVRKGKDNDEMIIDSLPKNGRLEIQSSSLSFDNDSSIKGSLVLKKVDSYDATMNQSKKNLCTTAKSSLQTTSSTARKEIVTPDNLLFNKGKNKGIKNRSSSSDQVFSLKQRMQEYKDEGERNRKINQHISPSHRMNENLSFCDADRFGMQSNFTILPTYKNGCNDSPRGLKRLFSELNSGRRI